VSQYVLCILVWPLNFILGLQLPVLVYGVVAFNSGRGYDGVRIM